MIFIYFCWPFTVPEVRFLRCCIFFGEKVWCADLFQSPSTQSYASFCWQMTAYEANNFCQPVQIEILKSYKKIMGYSIKDDSLHTCQFSLTIRFRVCSRSPVGKLFQCIAWSTTRIFEFEMNNVQKSFLYDFMNIFLWVCFPNLEMTFPCLSVFLGDSLRFSSSFFSVLRVYLQFMYIASY